MRFVIFYEHQLPRPWAPDDEYRLLQDALEQVELADRLGIDYLREVEHHSLSWKFPPTSLAANAGGVYGLGCLDMMQVSGKDPGCTGRCKKPSNASARSSGKRMTTGRRSSPATVRRWQS